MKDAIFSKEKNGELENNDTISKKALLGKLNEFCGKQRYLIPEEVWKIVEEMPAIEIQFPKDLISKAAFYEELCGTTNTDITPTVVKMKDVRRVLAKAPVIE